MTDQPPPQPANEQGIQAGIPPGHQSPTAIQETTPASETIPLPPMPPAPTPTPAPTAAGWTLFDAALLLLLAAFAFLLGSFVATNSDFWLHLATGRAIAEGQHQFGVDPFLFSSVRDGVPVAWINHSWLYDLGLYYLYGAFGGQGVVIFQAILAMALLFIVVSFYGHDSSRSAVLLLAGLTMLVVSQRIPANSLVISYVLLAALLALLRRGGALGALAEDEPSTRALWTVPFLFVAWVNLDAWFILGLIVLALVVVGNAVASALGSRNQSLKVQAFVLIASIAACMVNPYHIAAFTLPPELAYLLGGWLPPALGGGGDAVRALSQVDPDFQQAYGTPFRLPPGALTATSFTIDRIAFFVLYLLGFVSLLVAVVAATMKDGPPMPLGRLLVFGVAVVLGSAQTRLVPLFAVMAGPIIMLNFADFGQWLRRRPGADPEARFNPNLARLVTAVLVLLGLGLAWPGWLHARIGVPSQRHVAWQVQVDPSLKAAAETLAQAEAKNVFNLSFEIANYCAWFAPQVRCYVDQRYSLIAHEAVRYGKAKQALRQDALDILAPRQEKIDPAPPSGAAWRDVMRAFKIDHVALSRIYSDANMMTPSNLVTMMFWLDQRHWTQLYGDGFAMVFAWSPEGRGNPMALGDALNREAFGLVPDARRAPRNGADPITGGPTLESLYLERASSLSSRGAHAALMYMQYFEQIQSRWSMPHHPVWVLAQWSVPAGSNGVAPGSVLWSTTLNSILWGRRIPLRPRDMGPPAAPLLMIREARRCINDQPFEANGYYALYLAYKAQSQDVEMHWTVDKNERTTIRQVQMAAALRSYLTLQPDDWMRRRELSRLYYSAHLLDAGLEQASLALKSLEKQRRQTRSAAELEALKAQEKEAVDFHKMVTLDVKRRRNDFDLQTSKSKPVEKAYVAFQRPYKTVNNAGKDFLDYRGMGLALEALKQLEAIPPGSLPAEQMSSVYFFRFRVFMQLGQLAEAYNEFAEFSRSSAADNALLWYAAAAGDYELADKALLRMEEQSGQIPPFAGQVGKLRDSAVAMLGLAIAAEQPVAVRAGFAYVTAATMLENTNRVNRLAEALISRATGRTLRGILALEVGDTAQALEHFNEALRIAGPRLPFGDRAIAERYLELLRAQRK